MTCGQHRRRNQPIQIRPRRCACAFGVSAGRANSSRPMAEAMRLQQVAMDARDGFRFCQSRAASGSARRRVKLARPLWGLIRRFKTPISGQLVGCSIVGLNPMAAKGFKRRSARAPSDHDPGLLVSQRLLPNCGKLRPQPDRANEFPRAGGGGNTSSTQLPNTEDAVCWWR
jgi:hypothetical protein